MYASFVAVGDSFTEGLDDLQPDGTYRGWADLVAARLAARDPGLRYANLAVRGRRLERIRDEQVPRAVAMRPDLITLAAGGNDILGFRVDVPSLTESFHHMVVDLTRTGATVVGSPASTAWPAAAEPGACRPRRGVQRGGRRQRPGGGRTRRRPLAPRRAPGRHVGAGPAAPQQPRAPAVADAVLGVLGFEGEHATAASGAVTDAARRRWLAARRDDAAWARTYLAPWVGRKIRRRSTGDLVEPKRPELTRLAERAEPSGLSPRRIDLREVDHHCARDRA